MDNWLQERRKDDLKVFCPYEKGKVIDGLDLANIIPGVKVFHAGTTKRGDGKIVTAGGRVLCVTAYSENDLSHAIGRAYRAVDKISFEGGAQYRTDIGKKGLVK